MDICGSNGVRTGKVGYGARNAHSTVVAARRKIEACCGLREGFFRSSGKSAFFIELATGERGIRCALLTRTFCARTRAATTRSRTRSEGSPFESFASVSCGTSGTSIQRSRRSTMDREMRRACFSAARIATRESSESVFAGFIAATIIQSAGKVTLPRARETVTTRSSSGCRSASSVRESNSGNSSRKRTPLCASVTSPAFGNAPPPTIAT